MRRTAVGLLVLVLALLVSAPGALAVAPKASLGDLQDEVMCVSCNVALNVAESPQADATRRQISALIDRGYTKQQIKDELVREYGPRVLALPDTKGFNLAVYLVPILVAVGLIGLVIFLIPHWRRRGRERDDVEAAVSGEHDLSAADEQRLAAELARYDP